MGNDIQVKEEGGGSDGRVRGGHGYNNSITDKKSIYKRKISDIEDTIFTQGQPYFANKYKDSVKVIIKYDPHE